MNARNWIFLAALLVLPSMGTAVAQDNAVVDGTHERSDEAQTPDPKPQSGAEAGAEAADEARLYTARLRRCEGLAGAQRESCVELARKRLGQM